jgi:very-short-patch-repair endonuclease
MKSLLRRIGIKYRFQKPVWGQYYSAFIDFFITHPFYGVCIEVDGGYHKGREAEDQRREDKILLNHPNFRFVRIDNEQVLSRNAHEILLTKLEESGCDLTKLSRRNLEVGPDPQRWRFALK